MAQRSSQALWNPPNFATNGIFPYPLKKWGKRTEGDNSWILSVEGIVARDCDLSAKNPNRKDDYEHRPALELVQSIKAKEERIMDLLGELEAILEK
jgi:type I restriction enzyme M protein